jgi:catechol 2,3-dioxygenase-like lactoylglutathione lyase family enzyme
MIDHVILNVGKLEQSREFYVKTLKTLGYQVVMSSPEGVGLGPGGKPVFWIASRPPRSTGVHVAFVAENRRTVEAFHAAALEAGGKDNGAPGLRPHYHADYFGAFVLDPDGNNIEAVCHQAER